MTTQQLPMDFAARSAALERRRQLAQTMLQSGLTPRQGQMVGPHFVAPGWAGALSQIAQVAGGHFMGKQVEQDQAALNKDYQSGLAEGLEKYLRTREGTPGGVMNEQQVSDLMLNDKAPELAEPVKADPRRAVIEAMTSQFPELQKIGQMELGAMLKPKGRDPSMIKEAGGRFYDLSSGQPVEIGGNEFGGIEVINGDTYQRGPGGKLFKLDNATKVSTVVNNNPTQAGLKKYQEAVGESLAPGGKSRVAAEQAQEGLTASVEALQAVNDGARMGIAQPAMQVVRKLGAELGIANAETAPTDALSAALKQSVFKDLGGLGAQISDADRKFVTEFSGDLTTDTGALKRMLAIRIAAQIKKVNAHNKNVAAFGRTAEDPNFEGLAGMPLNIQIPDDEVAAMVDNVLQGKPTTAGMAKQPSGGKQAIPVQDWLRAQKGGR